MGSECPSYGERRCTHHQVCRTFSGCLVTTDYLNPRRVGIYAHAVQQTGFRQPETGLADKNTWATSAHPTANSVARIIRHTRAFSGCLVTTDYLNPRRVGIYAHAVQSVGFRQPETGLADKNAWAASAHPTENGVARIIRHTRTFSGCLVIRPRKKPPCHPMMQGGFPLRVFTDTLLPFPDSRAGFRQKRQILPFHPHPAAAR